jgi:hypothetical protein
MYPIGLFVGAFILIVIVSLIKFKKISKNDVDVVDPKPEVIPVEDVFHNMGIQSEAPKINITRKKPVLKKKEAGKKPLKTNTHTKKYKPKKK